MSTPWSSNSHNESRGRTARHRSTLGGGRGPAGVVRTRGPASPPRCPVADALLETSDSDVVERFVRRTTHSAFVDGFSILRLDFTVHAEGIVRRVRELADLVLWVEESPDGTLDFEVEQVGPRRTG